MPARDTAPSIEDLRREYERGRDPMAYLPYARALLSEKQLTQALEVCQRGLQNRPSLAGKDLLAHICFAVGRYEETLEALAQVLQEAPESFSANLLFARTQARRGELDEAADVVASLMEKNPAMPELAELAEQIRLKLAQRQELAPAQDESFSLPGEPASLEEFKSLALERLRRQPGVGYCVFQAPEDGDVSETQEAGRLLGIVLSQSRRIATQLGLGEPTDLMLDFEGGAVLARQAGPEFLVVEFGVSIPAGRMRRIMAQCLSLAI